MVCQYFGEYGSICRSILSQKDFLRNVLSVYSNVTFNALLMQPLPPVSLLPELRDKVQLVQPCRDVVRVCFPAGLCPDSWLGERPHPLERSVPAWQHHSQHRLEPRGRLVLRPLTVNRKKSSSQMQCSRLTLQWVRRRYRHFGLEWIGREWEPICTCESSSPETIDMRHLHSMYLDHLVFRRLLVMHFSTTSCTWAQPNVRVNTSYVISEMIYFPTNLLTGAKNSAFSTNHLADIDKTKHWYGL